MFIVNIDAFSLFLNYEKSNSCNMHDFNGCVYSKQMF